ncbi:hypothetical protein B4U79_14314, partial [Dinothrombium tinctorium]
LGIVFDKNLSFEKHILQLHKYILIIFSSIKRIGEIITIHYLKVLYYALVESKISYGIEIWGHTYRKH